MKRLFTLMVALTAITSLTFAQSNTMFLVEEGTQASCGPCAAQNPNFDALLDANADKVVVLKYQVWWPGFDPMYLDNEAEVDTRIAYYGINGVPTAVGNGALWANDCGAWEGAPACLNQAEIDAAHAVISPLTMEISANILDEVVYVTGTIVADEALAGNLKLRIALAEQTITYDDAPGGTNGETAYHHVMKAFVGGTSGIALPDMAAGDVYTISESMPINTLNIYNHSELEVVAFVQDDSDKTVYQAAKDQDLEISSSVANNVSSDQAVGLPGSLCAGTQSVTPVLRIVNNGSEVLTSAMINYTASGGASQSYSWSGSLSTLESDDVVLDPIDVESNLWNDATIEFTVSSPNGTTDEWEADNITWAVIPPAPESGPTVEVSITTDAYGDEVYWELRNGAGEIVASGGNPNVGLDNIGTGTFPPPADPGSYGNNTTYTEVIDLDNGECYTFHITDYYGDGLLGAAGYSLTSSGGVEIHDDSDDYQIEAQKSLTSGAVGLSENELSESISVGPNPASDIVNVRMNFETIQKDVQIQVMNSMGQVVFIETLGDVNGMSVTEIDFEQFDSGLYHVNVIAGKSMSSSKITVLK